MFIQSCTWECVHEHDCQTAVFFQAQKICSLFKKECQQNSIQSSGNDPVSVICYRKNYNPSPTCSSTITTNQKNEESTTESTIITTTGTTTTTTTMMRTTTANPSSTPVSVGTNSTIYSASSDSNSYTCHYFAWTAFRTGSVTLAVQFRNDLSFWYMDDVSVSDGTTEILKNGGFESGSFSPAWTASVTNGNCRVITDSVAAQIISSSCHYGSYCLFDGCCSHFDQISQSFAVTTGQIYFISFWLKLGSNHGNCGSGVVSISVTFS